MIAPCWCFQGKPTTTWLSSLSKPKAAHYYLPNVMFRVAHEPRSVSYSGKGNNTMRTTHKHQLISMRRPRGPTSPSTRLSEARSYANLATANAYWGLLPSPSTLSHPNPRILLEERALDSHQNILHSLTTFWRFNSLWPTRLTIVSHNFKRQRLAHVHCAALDFPPDRVEFIGIDPPGIGPEVLASEARAVEAWLRDPQGRGKGLRGKRAGRNCWGVGERVFADDAERARSGIETVVDEDGAEYLVEGALRPWGRGDN